MQDVNRVQVMEKVVPFVEKILAMNHAHILAWDHHSNCKQYHLLLGNIPYSNQMDSTFLLFLEQFLFLKIIVFYNYLIINELYTK